LPEPLAAFTGRLLTYETMSMFNSTSRDFDELELMMTCLAEDSQWLDSFQEKSLEKNCLSNFEEPKVMRISPDKESLSVCESTASSTKAVHGPSSYSASDISSKSQSNIPFKGRDSPPGNKRKLDMETDCSQHDVACDLIMLETSLQPAVKVSRRNFLAAEVASELPAPEFVKRGRSSVSSETVRLMRKSGLSPTGGISNQTSRISCVSMDELSSSSRFQELD
jgi:hypothetical protein